MSVEQGAIDAILLHHEFEFLAQGRINQPGGQASNFFQDMATGYCDNSLIPKGES